MKTQSLISEVIEAFRCLPGVGPKSAQRMLLYLLDRDREGGRRLAVLLADAMERIGNCANCRNFAEAELCDICDDTSRDGSLLCVVETPADVMAIEQSHSYRGYYFVLMGSLSPIDGRGPEEIGVGDLVRRVSSDVQEVILAVSSTVEGEATAHYIAETLKPGSVTVSRIAQGIPLGGELDFVDGGTLSHALQGRKNI
jgi:recombination protein RecR